MYLLLIILKNQIKKHLKLKIQENCGKKLSISDFQRI